MYTVILYRNGDDIIDLDKYQFLFSSMEQDDKLVLCKIEDNNEVTKQKNCGNNTRKNNEPINNKSTISQETKDLIRKINLIIGTHYVWKLLIFDGKNELSFNKDSLQMEKIHFWELIEFYLKGHNWKNEECCESSPEEIWYMGWMDREHILQKAIQLNIPVLSEHKLSAFCIPVNISSKMDKRYSAFMISCSLLILAINQFPIGFLRHKYLYFVNLEIDIKKFADYICRMYKDLMEINRLQGQEQLNLQKRRKPNFPYPDRIRRSISSNMPKHSELPKIEELKEGIIRKKLPGDIERVLNRNVQKVRDWMYYPRGIMSETVNQISEHLDKEQQNRRLLAEGFLSEEGRDKLEREKRKNLEEFSAKRKVLIDQKNFEYGFRKKENNLKKRSRKQIRGFTGFLIHFTIAIIEACFVFFLIAARNISHFNKTKEFSNGMRTFLKIAIIGKPVYYSNLIKAFLSAMWNSLKMKFFPGIHMVESLWSGVEAFWRIPVTTRSIFDFNSFYLKEIFLISFFGLFIILKISGMILWYSAKKRYTSYLEKNMIKKTQEKDEYLSQILALVEEYQYCIRIDKEQKELMVQWEEQEKNLKKHNYICSNSIMTMQKLKYLLDEEELIYPRESNLKDIDFMVEPQEISYYWFAYKKIKYKTELNHSGYMFESMLDFIEHLRCTEDP